MFRSDWSNKFSRTPKMSSPTPEGTCTPAWIPLVYAIILPSWPRYGSGMCQEGLKKTMTTFSHDTRPKCEPICHRILTRVYRANVTSIYLDEYLMKLTFYITLLLEIPVMNFVFALNFLSFLKPAFMQMWSLCKHCKRTSLIQLVPLFLGNKIVVLC
jgi:hypothetical protein